MHNKFGNFTVGHGNFAVLIKKQDVPGHTHTRAYYMQLCPFISISDIIYIVRECASYRTPSSGFVLTKVPSGTNWREARINKEFLRIVNELLCDSTRRRWLPRIMPITAICWKQPTTQRMPLGIFYISQPSTWNYFPKKYPDVWKRLGIADQWGKIV